MATIQEIIAALAGYGSYVLLGFIIYYLFRAITFGTAGKAKAAGKGIGKGLKWLGKTGFKKTKETYHAARRMYRLDKKIHQRFKKLKREIERGIKSSDLTKINEHIDEIKETLKKIGNLEKTEEHFDMYLNTLLDGLIKIENNKYNKDLKANGNLIMTGLKKVGDYKREIQDLIDKSYNLGFAQKKGFLNQAIKPAEAAEKESEKLKDNIVAIEILDKKIEKEFK